ncbi:MAG: hypothetical protein J1E39_06445 [Eubacterium sp.]|nr:hypothetical protein [Eubacterium sp.]
MKKRFIAFAAVLLLTACSAPKNVIILPEESQDVSVPEEAVPGDSGKYALNEEDFYRFNTNARLEIYGEDGLRTNAEFSLTPLEGDIEGFINFIISPDEVFRLWEVPVDVYVFCDGRLVPHSIDGGELTEMSQLTISTYNPVELPITIPEIKTEKGGTALATIIINAMPDFIPHSWGQQLATIQTCSFIVKAAADGQPDDAYHAAEKDYVTGILEDEYYIQSGFTEFFDLGYTAQRTKELGMAAFHMDVPMKVNDSSSLYFSAQYPNDPYDWYGMVFIDGKLYDAFDGKKFVNFYTEGNSMMCYEIKPSVLPEPGRHSMAALVLPSSAGIPYNIFEADGDEWLWIIPEGTRWNYQLVIE